MQVQASGGPWSCAARRGGVGAVLECAAACASLASVGQQMHAVARVQTQRPGHWMQRRCPEGELQTPIWVWCRCPL
eukprot:10202105-Alexandrium_andersonii.AAC.1